VKKYRGNVPRLIGMLKGKADVKTVGRSGGSMEISNGGKYDGKMGCRGVKVDVLWKSAG